MSQIIAGRFLGGVTFMFVNSIIIKLSWIVLPFQNADKDCLLMYDTLAQEKDQGRHTNVLKTYDAAPKNQFIFSKHIFWWYLEHWVLVALLTRSLLAGGPHYETTLADFHIH